MARTGSALALSLVIAVPALAADPEFYMTTDRTRVGTEDTFRLEIVVGGAPEGAVVQFPAPRDFEVLSRSESTQMSYTVGGGGTGVIKQVRKYTLVMRANRTGTLTIPGAALQTATKTYKTDSKTIEVVRGRLAPDTPPRRAPPSPFGVPPGFPGLPGFGPDEEDDPFSQFLPQESIPRSDSDLFLRSKVDKAEVYVGEQVMLSIYIYSRIALSSVDTVTMPKLEGFWSQDSKAPSQLAPESKDIGGVSYSEYLLRQKALFPMKPGEYTLEAAEADITTGHVFAAQRVHRKGNALKLKVKPLPPGGNTPNVGRWRLGVEVNQTEVTLGDPVQLKLVVEGQGNIQQLQVPPLEAPKSFRVFDPQTSDRTSFVKNALRTTRAVEYVLVPQQTGTFTLPGLTMPFFDPERGRYDEARTDPVTITVRPSAQGQTTIAAPANLPPGVGDGPKNQLVAGGLKSLRHTARFVGPRRATWSLPFFVPLAVAPAVLALLLGALGLVRDALGKQDPEAERRKQAKAARKRLAGAVKLLGAGSTADFYAEVERALRSFLEARLDQRVTGLTRADLDAAMQRHQVAEDVRQRVLAVFETCDMGRYAPGMGEASARKRAVDDAAKAMEAWT